MTVNVLLLRGHHPTVWGLRTFEHLPERYAVRLAVTGSSRYPLDDLGLERIRVRTVRDRIPGAALGAVATLALPDRILAADDVYAGANIVHAEELSLWFTAQAARRRPRSAFKLVVSVWETLPLLNAFRTPHARRFRAATLATADLFLPTTERARNSLLLEGIPPDKVLLVSPGVEVERFAVAPQATDEYLILSPGRLEWEKGHHDVLRAVAALKQGLIKAPRGAVERLRLQVVGSGPEEKRLHEHAAELGIADAVTIASVPYREMPALYGRASAIVLGSLPRAGCTLHPGDIPRCFWEEQFGLVVAESMAAGLSMILSTSGAIPEVAAQHALYVAPGDWLSMATALANGPLTRPPGARASYPSELVAGLSSVAAAERLVDAYERVLSAS